MCIRDRVKRILVGLVLGAILGLTVPGATGISILGDVFVSALKAIAPLLVFFLVISSLCNAGNSHGGVIKNLNARVEFGNIQGLRQGKVFGNTSVSILEAENGVLRWKLVNDMSHLPEELRRAPMQYTFHTEAL